MEKGTAYGRCLAMGRSALAGGRPEEAVRLLGRAVEWCPDLAEPFIHLAAALRELGQLDRARQAYGRALAVAPDGPEAADAAAGLRELRPVHTGRRERANFRPGRRLESERNGPCTVLEVRKGGFGVVYIVRMEANNDRKAFKTFDARLLWSDADQERFMREALTWVRLGPHPNVARAEDVEWIEGLPCVITAYAEGGDLMSLLRTSGPLEVGQALGFAVQLCDGLGHAHEQLGLVHRDVKPANCLLSADHTLRVTDFGLARAFDAADPLDAPGTQRSSGGLPPSPAALYTSVAGTPPYMAPEQFVPGVALDTRADVYAFGVVLFHMVTGQLPPGDGRARAHFDRMTSRRQRRTALYRLIRDCTAPDRAERLPHFAAVREQLDVLHREHTGRPAPAPAQAFGTRAEGWVSRALALRHLGRFEEALEAVREGLETAEQHQSGHVTLSKLWQARGMVLESMHRYEDALAAHDRAVTLNPDEATAWLSRGTVLVSLERREDALECFARTLALKPHEEYAWSNRAAVHGQFGRIEEAEEDYARALELSPRSHTVLYGRAVLRRHAGRTADALADLDRALRISPRYYPGLLQKASILRHSHRYAEALEVLRDAAEIHPDDAALWEIRMYAHGGLEQYEQALECCETALRRREARGDLFEEEVTGREMAYLWRYKGHLLGDLGRPVDSLRCYDRAVELAPDIAAIRLNRAGMLCELGRMEEALPEYAQVLRLAPETPRPWYLKAQALRRLDRPEESLACAEEGLATFPDHGRLRGERCVALIALGRLQEALPHVQDWRELDPANVDAWLNLVYLLYTLGRAHDAVVCADEALEVWPDHAELWRRKGHALERLARQDEA